MPDSPSERQRRYRLRKAGLLPEVERFNCEGCGGSHLGVHGGLCTDCWRLLTPEGRADGARRSREAQKRKRDKL